jgi:hypothetical protein
VWPQTEFLFIQVLTTLTVSARLGGTIVLFQEFVSQLFVTRVRHCFPDVVWEVCEGDACSSHAGKGGDYHYHGKLYVFLVLIKAARASQFLCFLFASRGSLRRPLHV